MAVIKSSVKLIIMNTRFYNYSGSMLTLGVPEIYATQRELEAWFPTLAGRNFSPVGSEIKITDQEVGRRLGWISAETFFRSLGLTNIISLDIPGSEHNPDLFHDLNQPFPDSLIGQFDFVLDPGTIEHVFDIRMALTNVARSLKVGGVVVHQVPVYSYNGGYYSINPNVLNDFYQANGFGEMKTYIIMWDRYRAYFGKHRCYEYNDKVLGTRHSLADYDQCRYSPHMLFFARKIEQKQEITIPLQFSGDYLSGLAGSDEPVEMTSFGSFLMIIKSFISRFFPPAIAHFMFAMVRRWLFLYQSRRYSFWI